MKGMEDILGKQPSSFQRGLVELGNMLRGPTNAFEKYKADPVGYVREVLKISPTETQEEILRALFEPPRRVMVRSGHSVGKTAVAAMAVNHWYDCYDPGLALTTAPSEKDVKDLLWKEVRTQRMRAGLPMDFIGPSAPEMRTAPGHYAKGYVAKKEFQGRHDRDMLFVFDEAMGVDRMFWETTNTMFNADYNHAWLVIFNPTNTTSIAYQQERLTDADGVPVWRVFTMSALDHPNVIEGREVIPGAVSRKQVASWIVDWCEPIHKDDALATDIIWEGQWYRPGPEMEGRALGRWPSQDSCSVWSDALWEAAAKKIDTAAPLRFDDLSILPEIGVDVAGAGRDNTDIHAGWGVYSLKHESYNGWMMPRKLGRIKELCEELAALVNTARQVVNSNAPICNPKSIRIKCDDANAGGELVALLRADGYNAVGVNAQQTFGVNLARYPDMRSQMWFSTAKQASMGRLKLGRLHRKTLDMLKAQAMAPTWWLDMAGRRVVEAKEKTMEKLGRSPDGIDAVNLQALKLEWKAPEWVQAATPQQTAALTGQQNNQRTLLRDRIRSRGHRSLFGRR